MVAGRALTVAHRGIASPGLVVIADQSMRNVLAPWCRTAANANHRYSDMMIENMIAAWSGQNRIIAAKRGQFRFSNLRFHSAWKYLRVIGKDSGDRQ